MKILGVLAVVYVVAACAAAAASDSPVPAVTSTAPASAETTASTPRSQETPARTVSPSIQPSADQAADELATRIVVKALGIDLPIVSGDLLVPSNPPDYPLCDVAQYLTTYRFPGRPGTTTWIYGHARSGMLLPLLDASKVNDGSRLVGLRADLYTDGARRYTYRITKVLRHATDRSSATEVAETDHRLVLQTSEGPRGTIPKLQVVAEFESVAAVDPARAMPPPSPRACFMQ
jgi:hypothetical protein